MIDSWDWRLWHYDSYSADPGSTWRLKHKMVEPVSRIFWLNFRTMGGGGDTSSSWTFSLVSILHLTHNKMGAPQISLAVFYLRVPVEKTDAQYSLRRLNILNAISAVSMLANLRSVFSFLTTSPRE